MASPRSRRFRTFRRTLPPVRAIISPSLFVTLAGSGLRPGIAVQGLIAHVK